MRLSHTAPFAATILLAACGSGADTNNDGKVSSEEVVAEAAGAIKPEPGQYRVVSEVLEFSIPGVPESMQNQMKAQMGGVAAKPVTFCLTPEQAAANGPEQMAKNMAAANCTVSKFNVSGGTVAAEMECSSPTGGVSHMTMDGQMTSTSSTMTMSMTNQMDPRNKDKGEMHMKTRVTSERIGDCAG